MSFTFDLSGLQAYINRLEERAPLAALQGAEVLADGLRHTVPVKTGELRDTITARPIEERAAAEVVAGEGLGDPRALVTNFGSVHQPAQHWWERGEAEAQEGIRDAVRDTLKGNP